MKTVAELEASINALEYSLKALRKELEQTRDYRTLCETAQQACKGFADGQLDKNVWIESWEFRTDRPGERSYRITLRRPDGGTCLLDLPAHTAMR